jgi:hypothetical protein
MDAMHRIYLYNAHAHALSGQILRPFQETIDVQAGMSLPTIGGYGSVRVKNFRLKEAVSFQAAYTHVMGSFDEHTKSHTTLVSTTIEGLNFLDVVTADRIVARLASHHPESDSEPHITMLGSHFVNLRIAGCVVNIELNHKLFLELDTFKALRNKLDSDPEFSTMALDPYKTGQAQKKPEAHGMVLCSLVKKMTFDCPGVTQDGHVLEVKDFGKVYVAELIAQHSRRTLTMLRLELGSPGGGSGAVGQAQSNGQPYPPKP